MQTFRRRFSIPTVVVTCVLLSGWFLILTVQHRLRAAQYQQRVNLTVAVGKELGKAFKGYWQAHQHFPSAQNWEQELRPYARTPSFSVVLPASNGMPQRRFAMYKPLSGLTYKKLNPPEWDRVVFYESTASGPSAADDLASLPPEGGKYGFAVVDFEGWASYVSPADRRWGIEQFKNDILQ